MFFFLLLFYYNFIYLCLAISRKTATFLMMTHLKKKSNLTQILLNKNLILLHILCYQQQPIRAWELILLNFGILRALWNSKLLTNPSLGGLTC